MIKINKRAGSGFLLFDIKEHGDLINKRVQGDNCTDKL